MATTQVLTGSNLNPTRVQERLISTIAERQNPFAPLIGTSSDSVIQMITDLQKQAGDTVKVNLRAKLAGLGVDGDSTLEGNEEAMSFYQDTVKIDQKRHAVRLDGQMTEQRSALKLRSEAGPALAVWGREISTEFLAYALSGARGVRTGDLILPTTYTGHAGNTLTAPDSGHQLIAGAGTKAGLTASDKMSTAVLDLAVRKIKLLINNGAAMRPVMINGQKYFHCFLTPEQEYDLRQDSAWKTAQQNAAERGGDNPLFTGALGIWNGLVLRTLDCGVLFSDYGAGANVGAARALILGAQAGAIAFGGVGGTTDGGGRWKYTEKQFDYDNQVGFAVKTIVGAKKLNFNGKDFGAFTVDTAYTA